MYPTGHFGFAAVTFLMDAPLTHVMVVATALVGVGLTTMGVVVVGAAGAAVGEVDGGVVVATAIGAL